MSTISAAELFPGFTTNEVPRRTLPETYRPSDMEGIPDHLKPDAHRSFEEAVVASITKSYVTGEFPPPQKAAGWEPQGIRSEHPPEHRRNFREISGRRRARALVAGLAVAAGGMVADSAAAGSATPKECGTTISRSSGVKCVKALQTALGYSNGDGIYGSGTADSVRAFQLACAIKLENTDGPKGYALAGPVTLGHLNLRSTTGNPNCPNFYVSPGVYINTTGTIEPVLVPPEISAPAGAAAPARPAAATTPAQTAPAEAMQTISGIELALYDADKTVPPNMQQGGLNFEVNIPDRKGGAITKTLPIGLEPDGASSTLDVVEAHETSGGCTMRVDRPNNDPSQLARSLIITYGPSGANWCKGKYTIKGTGRYSFNNEEGIIRPTSEAINGKSGGNPACDPNRTVDEPGCPMPGQKVPTTPKPADGGYQVDIPFLSDKKQARATLQANKARSAAIWIWRRTGVCDSLPVGCDTIEADIKAENDAAHRILEDR